MSGLLLPLRRRPTAAHPQRATVTIRGNVATFTDPATALAALTLPGEMAAPAARRYLAEFPPTEAEYLASVRSRGPRIVGLFEGYGGLTMGVQSVLGGTLAAYAEIEPAMVSLLAQRHPGVPNLGDVSTTDWSALRARLLAEYGVEHDGPLAGVVMTGGFPCQDVSLAGLRRGLRDGTRSGLWSEFARGIDTVRPGLVVIENVRGLLSAEADRNMEPGPWDLGRPERGHRPALRALGAVLGDLADLGYDARWCGVRAADAGAPHGRYRVFIVAHPAGQPWSVGHGDDVRARSGAHGRAPHAGAGLAPDADDLSSEGRMVGRGGWPKPASRRPAADADDRLLRQGRGDVAGSAPSRERTTPHGDLGPTDRDRGDAAADGDGIDVDGPLDGRRGRTEPAAGGVAAADTAGARSRRREDGGAGRGDAEAHRSGSVEPQRGGGERALAIADASGRGRDGRAQEPLGSEVERAAAPRGSGEAGAWGDYAPAIERWESTLGRVAPAPTNPDGKGGAHRLAPQFVEWMMGLPQGHVTDPALGLTRAQQLKALGNGVVPQQAALAVAALLEADVAEAVAA